MAKKIAVIFPGVGYTTDKPLLYYGKKIAKQNGYEIKEISFHDLPDDAKSSREKMMECFKMVISQSDEQLKDVDFGRYESIMFISKSIGTVGASVFAAKNDIPAKQVYFTPLEQTFSLIQEGNGLVFHGSRDPWVDVEKIRELCRKKKLLRREIKDADHSLETGSIQTDVTNMANIIQETEDYLVGGPIYQYSIPTRKSGMAQMSDYRGKILLIVNTATGCGFTPQYEGLEDIYEKYRSKGFEVLDFPCNQFMNQAPGSDTEIHNFCTSRYNISFPQFSKIEVNGSNELELYTFLKKRQGFKGFLRNTKESIYMEKVIAEADPDYQNNSDIKWNFTKFLVNRTGQVVDRFEPDVGTEIIDQAVARLINEEEGM